MMRRLLPWLPGVAALLALLAQLACRDAAGSSLVASKLFVKGGVWMLLPLVLGAVFLHYNRRRIVHWLLVAFLAGNFLLWSTGIVLICSVGPFANPLGFIFWPLLDYLALAVIFLLWYGMNIRDIIAAG